MKYIVTFSLLALLATNASAQISFTGSDFTSGRINATSYTAQNPSVLQPLVSVSGANQTWDFSAATYTLTLDTAVVTILTYPGGAPLASDPDFITATNVIKIIPNNTTEGTEYFYIRSNADGYWALGLVTTDNTGTSTKTFSYTPPLQEYKFPLTYGTAWTSVSNFNLTSVPPGATYTQSINAVVDGWGTLTTPSSQSNATLRLKKIDTSSFSFMSVSQTTISYNFEWLTKSAYGASIAANASQSVTSADYTAPSSVGSVSAQATTPEDALNLYLSQNPATNTETTLSYSLKSDGPVRVEMMDALGRDVRVLQDGRASAGENVIPIDPNAFAPGSYFIRVRGEGMSAIRKLIITR